MGPRSIAVARIAFIACVAASCTAPPNVVDTTEAPSYESAELTRDHQDAYVLSELAGDRLKVEAESSNSLKNNTRVIAWEVGSSPARNQQVCTTFTNDDYMAQEGVALRIRNGLGKTTAVTVTKNIILGKFSTFQFHTWDTSRESKPFLRFASARFDALEAGARHYDYPWTICARVEGRTVTAKVWPTSQPEPSWDDPESTAAKTIPLFHGLRLLLRGHSGVYAGHLPPGASITFSDTEVSNRARFGRIFVGPLALSRP